MSKNIDNLLAIRKKACPKCFACRSKRGFSIGEVVIATFVLAAGIVAVLGLITKSTASSIDSRDEIIASQLAQEGEELMRNIRDNNYAAATPRAYDTGIGSPGVTVNTCVDYLTPTNTGAAPSCVVAGSYALYFDTTNLKYTQTSGTNSPTKFYRKIIITDSPTVPAGKQIESKVWWSNTEPGTCNSVSKCVTSSSKLTDWK